MQDCINQLYELKELEQKTRLIKANQSNTRNIKKSSFIIHGILLITILLVIGYGITTSLI